MPDATLIACHSCDLLQARTPLPVHGRAFCSRCGALLYRHHRWPIDQPLATALASLLLFVVANGFPFMSFELAGRTQVAYLASGVADLWASGFPELAGLVLLCSLVAPALVIGALLFLLLPLRFGWRLPGSRKVCRALTALQPWAMLEVYLLALIVSLIKLTDEGSVELGLGAVAFGALILTLTLALASFEREVFWDRVGLPA